MGLLMFKIVLALFICFFATNAFPFLYAQNTNVDKSSKYEFSQSSYWKLEYHDELWWWVQYDEDGAKIMEIPADF